MNFKIFQLYEQVVFDEAALARMTHYLRELEPINAGQNLDYLINGDVEHQDGIIVGSISEEYIPNTNEMNDEKILEPVDNIEPYERTIFAFDFYTRNLLLQNRNYPPTNLNPGRTYNRLKDILADAFQAVFNMNFTLIPTTVPEGNELFTRIINTSRVIELQFSNLNNRGFCREDIATNQIINAGMHEFWNNDSTSTDLILLKSTIDGEINDHPFVQLAINSENVVIDIIRFYDSETDKNVKISRSSLDKVEIENLHRDEDSITAFQQILEFIPQNRAFLRRVRNIE